ncbi:MAG: hypothetical protein JSV14_15290 [Deltaproteobacteria bacterium]|nr:MAG: hypothetical protein JSV14_15290 [Deltaproteobacteria bacterium]
MARETAKDKQPTVGKGESYFLTVVALAPANEGLSRQERNIKIPVLRNLGYTDAAFVAAFSLSIASLAFRLDPHTLFCLGKGRFGYRRLTIHAQRESRK